MSLDRQADAGTGAAATGQTPDVKPPRDEVRVVLLVPRLPSAPPILHRAAAPPSPSLPSASTPAAPPAPPLPHASPRRRHLGLGFRRSRERSMSTDPPPPASPPGAADPKPTPPTEPPEVMHKTSPPAFPPSFILSFPTSPLLPLPDASMVLPHLAAPCRTFNEESYLAMKERRPLYMLKGPLENAPHARDFVGALKASYDRTGLPALIAEVKKASPSRGVLRENFDPGSFDYLQAIRNSGVKCPLLCKEFIVDAWQLHYARSKGADAVLLIAAVLPDLDIKYMLKICKILRMAALVEVHDEREMDRVLGIDGIQLIGINNDLNRAHTLICCAAIPPFC